MSRDIGMGTVVVWGVLAVGPLLLGASATPRSQQKPSAAAVTVTCGQLLTTNTTVSNDLTDCPADGLRIGASGITVNLNGHTIDGAEEVFASIGIRNSTFDNVVIRNGTVTDFGTGISFQSGADSSRLQGMRVTSNRTGINVATASDNVVITGNAVFANTADGIDMSEVDATQVMNNTVTGNGFIGIDAGFASSRTVVTGNRALSNSVHGISIAFNVPGARVTNNIANANETRGIQVGNAETTVTGNTTSFNTELGINALPGVRDGGSNRATGNGSLHQCENIVCS